MSDEREGRSRPDETRPFSFGQDDDATRVQRSGGQNGPDDQTRAGDAWVFDRPEDPADDRTQVPGPGHDPTAMMPPARDDWAVGAAAGGEAPWAGRAAVRPPRAGEYADTEADWAAPEREPRRKWWMPILIGIIALLLLGLLAWGIWLIIQAQNNNQTPAPAPSPSIPATAATPSATPTTTPPTTQATTTSPTPTSVTIPALRGMSQSDAQKTLSHIGLSSRLRYIATNQAAAGIVIDTDPSEGKQVPQGTTVTLIVAAQPPTIHPTSPSPSGGLIPLPGQ